MARLDWLPGVLRDAGLDVYVMPGAETRGRDDIKPKGVVGHHTATGTNWNDDHVAFLLRDGRRDLAGPLSQLGLERDGTFVVVALGRANHNGYGMWGNDSIGIEAYNKGDGIDPWPAVQIDAYQRGTAAILRHLGLTEARFKGHRETDPKRKPDPRGIDLDDFRRQVADLLAGTPQEDDDMARFELYERDTNGEVWLVGEDCRFHILPDALPYLSAQWGDPKPVNEVAWHYIVQATALDRTGARSIPPSQFAALAANQGDIDEAEVVDGVLAGLSAEVLVKAMSDAFATEVVEAIGKKLAG